MSGRRGIIIVVHEGASEDGQFIQILVTARNGWRFHAVSVPPSEHCCNVLTSTVVN